MRLHLFEIFTCTNIHIFEISDKPIVHLFEISLQQYMRCQENVSEISVAFLAVSCLVSLSLQAENN